MRELPTIEELHEFVKVANKVRAALDLPTIEKLDFDAIPSSVTGCISARALGCPEVGKYMALTYDHSGRGADDLRDPESDPSPVVLAFGALDGAREFADQVAKAIGRKPVTRSQHFVEVPEATALTDAFDNRRPGLRERLEEAGVL